MFSSDVNSAVSKLAAILAPQQLSAQQAVQTVGPSLAAQQAQQFAAAAQALTAKQLAQPGLTAQADFVKNIGSYEDAQAAQRQAAAQALAQGSVQYIPNATPGMGGHATALPYKGPKNVQGWVNQALGILHLNPKLAPGIMNLIQHESGGNPNSINRWDSNAKAGHPSQGLMQTIPGTFQAYALPGYNKNILDPVSNIIAGTRYALKNYGAGMLMSGGRHDSHGNYIGY